MNKNIFNTRFRSHHNLSFSQFILKFFLNQKTIGEWKIVRSGIQNFMNSVVLRIQ
jgi:hypothetical protein